MTAEAPPSIVAGRYRVIGVIGEGGMGQVLEVETSPGRRYAAKVLKATFRDDEELVQRMFREAQSAAAIRHPGIVGVHAIAHDAVLGPVLIMERLHGHSLRELAQHPPLDPVQARWLALQVLDALAAAHRHRIVHRDIKPANILIERASGRVRLMDFGVAGILVGPQLTLPGKFLGTMRFASPEQILTAKFSPQSDIYSLGVTLLWAMTGRHVPNRDVMAQRPPQNFLARLDISPWWRTVLERALQPEPGARYESAEAMAEVIRSLPAQPMTPLVQPQGPPDPAAAGPATTPAPAPGPAPAPSPATTPAPVTPPTTRPPASLALWAGVLGCLLAALALLILFASTAALFLWSGASG